MTSLSSIHDSQLEAEISDTEFGFQSQPADGVDEHLWEVVEILKERKKGKGKKEKIEFHVKWAGLDSRGKPWANSWVPREDVTDDLVHEWKLKKKRKEKEAKQRKEKLSTTSSKPRVSTATTATATITAKSNATVRNNSKNDKINKPISGVSVTSTGSPSLRRLKRRREGNAEGSPVQQAEADDDVDVISERQPARKRQKRSIVESQSHTQPEPEPVAEQIEEEDEFPPISVLMNDDDVPPEPSASASVSNPDADSDEGPPEITEESVARFFLAHDPPRITKQALIAHFSPANGKGEMDEANKKELSRITKKVASLVKGLLVLERKYARKYEELVIPEKEESPEDEEEGVVEKYSPPRTRSRSPVKPTVGPNGKAKAKAKPAPPVVSEEEDEEEEQPRRRTRQATRSHSPTKPSTSKPSTSKSRSKPLSESRAKPEQEEDDDADMHTVNEELLSQHEDEEEEDVETTPRPKRKAPNVNVNGKVKTKEKMKGRSTAKKTPKPVLLSRDGSEGETDYDEPPVSAPSGVKVNGRKEKERVASDASSGGGGRGRQLDLRRYAGKQREQRNGRGSRTPVPEPVQSESEDEDEDEREPELKRGDEPEDEEEAPAELEFEAPVDNDFGGEDVDFVHDPDPDPDPGPGPGPGPIGSDADAEGETVPEEDDVGDAVVDDDPMPKLERFLLSAEDLLLLGRVDKEELERFDRVVFGVGEDEDEAAENRKSRARSGSSADASLFNAEQAKRERDKDKSMSVVPETEEEAEVVIPVVPVGGKRRRPVDDEVEQEQDPTPTQEFQVMPETQTQTPLEPEHEVEQPEPGPGPSPSPEQDEPKPGGRRLRPLPLHTPSKFGFTRAQSHPPLSQEQAQDVEDSIEEFTTPSQDRKRRQRASSVQVRRLGVVSERDGEEGGEGISAQGARLAEAFYRGQKAERDAGSGKKAQKRIDDIVKALRMRRDTRELGGEVQATSPIEAFSSSAEQMRGKGKGKEKEKDMGVGVVAEMEEAYVDYSGGDVEDDVGGGLPRSSSPPPVSSAPVPQKEDRMDVDVDGQAQGGEKESLGYPTPDVPRTPAPKEKTQVQKTPSFGEPGALLRTPSKQATPARNERPYEDETMRTPTQSQSQTARTQASPLNQIPPSELQPALAFPPAPKSPSPIRQRMDRQSPMSPARLSFAAAQAQDTRSALEAEVAQLKEQLAAAQKGKADAESHAEFLREQYNAASSTVGELNRANGEIKEELKIARGQVREGVQMVKMQWEKRARDVEADRDAWRRQAMFVLEKVDRTNDEVRRKASLYEEMKGALERERRKRREAEKEVQGIEEEVGRIRGVCEELGEKEVRWERIVNGLLEKMSGREREEVDEMMREAGLGVSDAEGEEQDKPRTRVRDESPLEDGQILSSPAQPRAASVSGSANGRAPSTKKPAHLARKVNGVNGQLGAVPEDSDEEDDRRDRNFYFLCEWRVGDRECREMFESREELAKHVRGHDGLR